MPQPIDGGQNGQGIDVLSKQGKRLPVAGNGLVLPSGPKQHIGAYI